MKKMIAITAILATSTALAAMAQDTSTTPPPAGATGTTTDTGSTTGTTGTGTMTDTDSGTGATGTGTTTGTGTMTDTGTSTGTTSTGTDTMPGGMGGTTMTGDMQVPEGFTQYAGEPMTAEDLRDADVYSMNDESVSSISDFVLAEDGQIEQVIFDVGGFLGIGARNVALPFEELQIYTNQDNTDIRVYVPMSRDELESMPAYTATN